MGLLRSTYYDTPATEADTEIVARITAICEEFEAYGYRRVGAARRHQGIVANGKKIRRLMRPARPAAQASQAFHRHNRQRSR